MNRTIKHSKATTLRNLAIVLILAVVFSFIGCKKEKDPFIEFEGDIFIKNSLEMSGYYSSTVQNWIKDSQNRPGETITAFVLSYSEKLDDGRAAYHYLILRTHLSDGSMLDTKTLKNSNDEVVELNYIFANLETDESVLTYICYKSDRKPVLDIILTDSTGTQSYLDYVETIAYEPFDLNITN